MKSEGAERKPSGRLDKITGIRQKWSTKRKRENDDPKDKQVPAVSGQQRQQEQQAEVPEHLRQQLRLKKPPKGDGSIGVEKLLLSLFETSIKSFNHSDALKNKLRDKTVSLHPSGMSLSSVRKKHTPWRQGEQSQKQTKKQKEVTRWHNMRQQLAEQPGKAEQVRAALSKAWGSYINRLSCIPRGSAALTETLSQCSWIGAPLSVLAARDARHIGLKGVAVWDTKDYIHVLPDGRPIVTSVPKTDAVVAVELPSSVGQKYGHPRILHVGSRCPWEAA